MLEWCPVRPEVCRVQSPAQGDTAYTLGALPRVYASRIFETYGQIPAENIYYVIY